MYLTKKQHNGYHFYPVTFWYSIFIYLLLLLLLFGISYNLIGGALFSFSEDPVGSQSRKSSLTILGQQLTVFPMKKLSFFGDKKEIQRSATVLGYVAHVSVYLHLLIHSSRISYSVTFDLFSYIFFF